MISRVASSEVSAEGKLRGQGFGQASQAVANIWSTV